MISDYNMSLPSLDGILRQHSIAYGNIQRPVIIEKIFDRPFHDHKINPNDAEGRKIIEDYFHDLYSIFLKKLSHFAIESNPAIDEPVKLTALFQEILKIKKLLDSSGKIIEK